MKTWYGNNEEGNVRFDGTYEEPFLIKQSK